MLTKLSWGEVPGAATQLRPSFIDINSVNALYQRLQSFSSLLRPATFAPSTTHPPAPASPPDAMRPPPPAASSSRRSATPAAAAPSPAVTRTRTRRRGAALPRPASPPALAPKPIMHYHSNRTTRWGLISFSAIQSHGIDPPYSGGSLGLRCRWLEPSEGLAPHRFNLPEHIE